MNVRTHMYAETKTWNPFVGCLHDCIYCRFSFQQQLKRWGKHNCQLCYGFKPHYHVERLHRIPSAKIIFVCGDGDIAFCDSGFLEAIVDSISAHNRRCPYKTYYFQSKNWQFADRVLWFLEKKNIKNAIILETLETNRDEGYKNISKAPPPTKRHSKFLELNYSRKVITIEPLLDFDLNAFFEMVVKAEPEYVWMGYNSKPNRVRLPEPSLKKTAQLIEMLKASGIEVRGKNLRGLKFSSERKQLEDGEGKKGENKREMV